MIKTIDGAAFARMMLSAAAEIDRNKQKVNELNVFPVPDGDTGTNMSMTLAAAAQAGSINPDLLTGASFTVSNLGSLDVEMFTPIINPPQTGILGVDCMIDRIRVVDGQITAYTAMGISLTYDHRALDGAPASRFLKDLKTAMENFTSLMAQ